MKLITAKARSWRVAALSLLALWASVYLVALDYRDDMPTVLFFVSFSLVFGWFLLPINLVYNLFGFRYSTPDWLYCTIVGGYWISVLSLQVAFLRKRHWIVLAILGIILLVSAKGCCVQQLQGL